ncbi:MAG: hypothetical protein ACR2P7_02245 [bacterium]
MKTKSLNSREKEVVAVIRDNPKVDMKQVREWIELAEFLDSIPAPQQEKSEPVKLQPIPLEMFSR